MDHFFLRPEDGLDFIKGSYHWGLVFLSVLVPICLSMMALHTAKIALDTQNKIYKHIAIAMGGVSLGGGIWAMHFIGMMAFILPAPVHYDIPITVISLFPGWAAAWLTMYMLARSSIPRFMLLISAVLMGAGIGTMHYIGMEAMVTPLQMRYEPVLFFLSIVVAVVLAMIAIWIQFGLRKTRLNRNLRFVMSGVIMGIAISGMHYTGMAAVRFIGQPSSTLGKFWVDSIYIAVALFCLAITIGVMVSAINGMVHSHELLRQITISKSRLQTILDTAIDAIITIDGYGIVQEFNHAAEQLFGYQASEVIGQNVKMLMPEPYHSEHDGYLRSYRETSQAKIIGIGREVVGKRKDGSTMPIRLAVGKVDMPDKSMLFVGLIVDISEKQKLESSLRETAQKAEQAAAAKTSFLANMSHEIRTPMNSILGFTDLVLQTELNNNQRNYLNTIKQSSRTLLRLINDILDTTKIEHGQMQLESNDFSLKALAMQIESSLRLGAEKKGLYLHTHYPDNIPEYFRGDQLRLLQILTNLVGNAIKFTESGGIDVFYNHDGKQIYVQVKDSGIGMTPEQVAQIFEPFTQADASISRRFGGTGLGTTISLQLAQAMGGHIDVTSALGQGSTFHIYLPLALGQKPDTAQQINISVKLPALKVLIADDVEQNLELLRLTLENKGHTVVSASDGAEAFAKYKNDSFDVILMDVHMPNIDGLQATRLIREYEQQHNKSHTSIIALTASVMAHDRQAAQQAGMNGFAVKPLDIPSLFQEIANVLNIVSESELIESSGQTKSDDSLINIDWARGLALWGSKDKLSEKIKSFLEQAVSKYHLDAKDINAKDLQFNLHSLRGASGNLALTGLYQRTVELENLVNNGDAAQAVARLPELQELLALIEGTLDCTSVSEKQTTVAENIVVSPEQLQQAISVLATALQHNELDDNALDIVCQAMDNAQADRLRLALDDFNFTKANEIFEQWRNESNNG